MDLSRRGLFRLLAGAAAEPVARRYFFAPIGGWRPNPQIVLDTSQKIVLDTSQIVIGAYADYCDCCRLLVAGAIAFEIKRHGH